MAQNQKLKPAEGASIIVFGIELGWFGGLCLSYVWIKDFFEQEKERYKEGSDNAWIQLPINLKQFEFLAVLLWISLVIQCGIHLIWLKGAVCQQSPKKIKTWCKGRDFWISLLISLCLISVYYKTNEVFIIMPILGYAIFTRLVVCSLLELPVVGAINVKSSPVSSGTNIKPEEV